MLSLYRALLTLRRAEPALSIGDYISIEIHEHLLTYRRQWQDKSFLIALNIGDETQLLATSALRGHIVLTTRLDRQGEAVTEELSLQGNEGVIGTWVSKGVEALVTRRQLLNRPFIPIGITKIDK